MMNTHKKLKIRLCLSICILLSASPFLPCAASARQRSILFVASGHELGSGGYCSLVDPRYKRELEEEGWTVGYAMLSSLSWDSLRKFNVVVVQQHPDVERFRLDKVFDRACELIPRYVEAGGGIFVFGDLHRGRIYGNLNRLLEPFGARFYYQIVDEKDPKRRRDLANYRATKALMTESIVPSPITQGVKRIWYPRFAQTTATFGVDDHWQVIVRGSPTSYSRRLGEDATAQDQPTYSQSPPLAACRQYGKGRIVLFASHSSWYTLDPYHYMWDEGFFLREGDAKRFLSNAYEWLADPSSSNEQIGGFRPAEQTALFDIGPRLKESVRSTVTRSLGGPIREGIIGIHTRYSGGTHAVDDFCAAAKKLGLDYLVFTEDQKRLDAGKWRQLEADCRRNTDDAFLAIPGARFRGQVSNNKGVVFNLNKPWPELPWEGKGFDTFIRLGCKNGWRANTAQVSPGLNAFPYYNQGAINAHTLFTYQPRDGHMLLVDEARQSFLDTNANGWRLAPHTYHDIWEPEQLRAAAQTYRTCFHMDRWGKTATLGRDSLLNTSVSNGPRIEHFSLSEPGPWIALDNRTVVMKLRVSSAADLTEVKLYFGSRLMRCFRPRQESFEATVRFVTSESHDAYLVVRDASGHMAFSKGLPAHRVRFHHFIGSDRMNGYWWPAEAATPQEATNRPAGKWARLFGSLYPRLGWGETIGCVSPSQMDRPMGLETGNPDGGVKQIYVSPQLRAGGRVEFRQAAPRRTFPLDSIDCVIVEDEITHDKEYYEEAGQRKKRVKAAQLLSARVRTIGFRWRNPIMLMIDTEVRFKQDVTLPSVRKHLALRLFKAFCGAKPQAYGASLHLSQEGKILTNNGVLVPAPTPLPPGGYVALSRHPFGVPAIFSFDRAHFTIREGFGVPQIEIGDDLRGASPRAGDTIRRKYLFVLTAGGDRDRQLFEQIHDRYGFDGTPAYTVSIRGGELLDATYSPLIKTEQHGVVCTISQADLPNPLGLRIEGLNENWDAVVYDLDDGKLAKHVATHNGTGYLALDVSRPRRVFLGCPVTADDPRAKINVLGLHRAAGNAVIHNPTPDGMDLVVAQHPHLPNAPPLRRRLTLAPGAQREVAWP